MLSYKLATPLLCDPLCDDMNGLQFAAVHARRKKGILLDGIHCQVRNNNLWINTEAVEQWIENGLLSSRKA